MTTENNNLKSNFQYPLELSPSSPYSEKYFIPHSGVQGAISSFEKEISLIKDDNTQAFKLFYIFGPKGSGKKHLASILFERVQNLNINTKLFLETSDKSTWIRSFISSYEELKSKGGVLIAAGSEEPEKAFINPHSGSRLRTAFVLELSYPQEEELEPLLKSLAEKNNIKLSKSISNYLLRRIPARPLSFSDILARINELSLVKGKPVNQPVVREALEKAADKLA